MSFDLFVFERRKEIGTSTDVLRYYRTFTEYEEDRDYNSLEGCTEPIIHWAKKMFLKFPPLLGDFEDCEQGTFKYKDEKDRERFLADYSFGKHGVYISFAFSVADDALRHALSFAEECGVGVFDFQSSEMVYGKGLEVLKYRTEDGGNHLAEWEDIERLVKTLDSPERGKSARDIAFLTLWFEESGKKKGEGDYIQCAPNYVRNRGLKPLLKKEKRNFIEGYCFEVMKNGSLYHTELKTKEELLSLIERWCRKREDIDTAGYRKLL